jgi:hypothetical protein
MFALYAWLLARARAFATWMRDTWKEYASNPWEYWRPDVDIVGELGKDTKAPHVNIHVLSLRDGVILTLSGYDNRGARSAQIGAHMAARETLDAVVNSLVEARDRTWP